MRPAKPIPEGGFSSSRLLQRTGSRWVVVDAGERGSIAPAVPVIAALLLLLGGLGIDSSRQLNARGEAVAFAEEAARAGAQGVNINAEGLELDLAVVKDRVATYCQRVLQLDQVTSCRFVGVSQVSGGDPRVLVVETAVQTRIETTLLGMVGVRSLSASATAKARPFEGLGSTTDAP